MMFGDLPLLDLTKTLGWDLRQTVLQAPLVSSPRPVVLDQCQAPSQWVTSILVDPEVLEVPAVPVAPAVLVALAVLTCVVEPHLLDMKVAVQALVVLVVPVALEDDHLLTQRTTTLPDQVVQHRIPMLGLRVADSKSLLLLVNTHPGPRVGRVSPRTTNASLVCLELVADPSEEARSLRTSSKEAHSQEVHSSLAHSRQICAPICGRRVPQALLKIVFLVAQDTVVPLQDPLADLAGPRVDQEDQEVLKGVLLDLPGRVVRRRRSSRGLITSLALLLARQLHRHLREARARRRLRIWVSHKESRKATV